MNPFGTPEEWDAFIAQARDRDAHMPQAVVTVVHPEGCRCGEHPVESTTN